MKKLWLPIAVIAAVVFLVYTSRGVVPSATKPTRAEPDNGAAFPHPLDKRDSNTQIERQGIVKQLLPDDKTGNRHQRFIVRLSSGQTLLIAHNVDLAETVSALKVGDMVTFRGEYEWNSKGGVIHWTHRDPDGKHESGWIKHNGRLYQ